MRCGFVGFSISYGKKEMFQALMEGVIYRMKTVRKPLTRYLPKIIP